MLIDIVLSNCQMNSFRQHFKVKQLNRPTCIFVLLVYQTLFFLFQLYPFWRTRGRYYFQWWEFYWYSHCLWYSSGILAKDCAISTSTECYRWTIVWYRLYFVLYSKNRTFVISVWTCMIAEYIQIGKYVSFGMYSLLEQTKEVLQYS